MEGQGPPGGPLGRRTIFPCQDPGIPYSKLFTFASLLALLIVFSTSTKLMRQGWTSVAGSFDAVLELVRAGVLRGVPLHLALCCLLWSHVSIGRNMHAPCHSTAKDIGTSVEARGERRRAADGRSSLPASRSSSSLRKEQRNSASSWSLATRYALHDAANSGMNPITFIMALSPHASLVSSMISARGRVH